MNIFSAALQKKGLIMIQKFKKISPALLSNELKLTQPDAKRFIDGLIIQGYIIYQSDGPETKIHSEKEINTQSCGFGCKSCPFNGGCVDNSSGNKWEISEKALKLLNS
jgi:hypothetical protein